jgi:hypothetical protein
MNRTHLTCTLAAVLIGTILAPRSVMADASESVSETPQPPVDPGRPMRQFWSGFGVYMGTALVGGMFVVMSAAPEDSNGWSRAAGYTGAGIMLAAPALAGATVCVVGRRSPYHRGGCGAPIAAAYGGLLAGTGLLMLAGHPPADGLLLAGMLGVFILPTAAAVAGWELFKTPVSPPGRREARGREPPRPHTRAGITPGALAFPLFVGNL